MLKLARNAAVIVLAFAAVARAAEGPAPGSFRDVIAQAKPAVVYVVAARTPGKVLQDSTVDLVNPFPLHKIPGDVLRFAFNLPILPFEVLAGADREAAGSGFIISPDGYVITNHHVVDRANRIKVELPDKNIYKAAVVGTDPFADIALIKLELPEGTALPTLPLGDSDTLQQGDWVIAIGSPFALKWTCTTGIVSAVGRNVGVTEIDDLIQTEASLDRGNSGGPLINTSGEVVGINTATLFLAENKGFCVPINMAKEIIPDLKEHGKPARGQLGISVIDITSEVAEENELAVQRGALVTGVRFGSHAWKAGIRSGDAIVGFDGHEITDARQLPRLARKAAIGRSVRIKLYREKEARTFDVEVDEMKERISIF